MEPFIFKYVVTFYLPFLFSKSLILQKKNEGYFICQTWKFFDRCKKYRFHLLLTKQENQIHRKYLLEDNMNSEDRFAHIFSNINFFRSAYTLACVFTVPFLFVCITGNVIMLVCLWQCRTLYPPFKALLRNLVLADLGVGVVVQPLFLASKLTALTQNFKSFCMVHKVYTTMGCCIAAVSFLTSTAIAVDRVIAIQLRLRYRQFATLRKAHLLLIFIWVLCLVISCVWIWDVSLYKIIRNVFLCSCIIVASISYIRVFAFLSRHQVGLAVNQTQPNAADARPSHMARYKTSVNSAAYVFCFLLLCYLPFSCLSIADSRRLRQGRLLFLYDFASALVFANSSFNVVLYCWRIREIRQIAKATFRKIFCKRN